MSGDDKVYCINCMNYDSRCNTCTIHKRIDIKPKHYPATYKRPAYTKTTEYRKFTFNPRKKNKHNDCPDYDPEEW